MWRIQLILVSIVLLSCTPHTSAQQKIYWTTAWPAGIQRANLDGSDVEVLITGDLDQPAYIALDLGAHKMYWTDSVTAKIQRANLDGSRVEDLITDELLNPAGIALDLDVGKIYWTDSGAGKIQRSNLDGSAVEDLVTSDLITPTGIALDHDEGKMYWTDAGLLGEWNGKIQRANLDGTQVEDILTEQWTSLGIALDMPSRLMYWAVPGQLRRASFDGSGVEILLYPGHTRAVALDLDVGKMYWTVFPGMWAGIQRANLDGTDVEWLPAVLNGWPNGITLDLRKSVRTVGLDISPHRCPNRVNTSGRGFLTMAVVGSVDFDVTMIDSASIVLTRADGIGGRVTPITHLYSAPRESAIRDEAASIDGGLCECRYPHPHSDGIADLRVGFYVTQVAEALKLGDLERGEIVTLALRGLLSDGSGFEAFDCVVLAGPRK